MSRPDSARTDEGLFYRRHGDHNAARALVLCHGLASNSSRWNELGRSLDLPPGWCLLCPDLRGHGHNPWRGRLDSDRWISDLAEMTGHAGVERVVMGGHCLGANLALRFAHARPHECAGLVLIEPMLPVARTGRLRRLARLAPALRGLAALVRMANVLGIRRREIPVLDLETLDRETRHSMAQAGNERAMVRRYASPLPDLKYIPTAAYLQSLHQTLAPLPGLDEIRQPALALISSGGLFGDPERTRQALAALPDLSLTQLEARHWIPTEQPEQLRKHLSDWLATRFG